MFCSPKDIVGCMVKVLFITVLCLLGAAQNGGRCPRDAET